MPELTVKELKEAYPEIYQAIFDQGFSDGKALTDKARSDGAIQGAESERNRIKSVEDQFMPGHEDLVAALKYDGVTTGPEAAVKIVAAEKLLRSGKLTAFTEEHTKLAAIPVPPMVDAKKTESDDSALSPEDRAKKVWDADPAIRAEFKNDFNAYRAFAIAEAAGQVKIYRGGK